MDQQTDDRDTAGQTGDRGRPEQRTVLSAESLRLPPAPPPGNYGRTTAAWTTVAIVIVGALASAVGIVVGQAWLCWAGLGVVVVGLVVGLVLRRLGLGQPGPVTPAPRPGPTGRRRQGRP